MVRAIASSMPELPWRSGQSPHLCQNCPGGQGNRLIYAKIALAVKAIAPSMPELPSLSKHLRQDIAITN